MKYSPVIGLEVHAELKTQTKMFCVSINDPNEKEPNVNVCPVCMAHPGTLPVINRETVKHVLRVGAALGSTLADYTEFDRKSYFYPDLPKGYQISQYKYPLVSGGQLAGVRLTRIHLEEDTASSIHHEQSGATLIDYNRAGIPLMELVTEPVIPDAKTAGAFARELQILLRYLGTSEANMEKGEMRVEAIVSVSKDGVRGTKVEVKNLNSFRSVERAIEFEIERQTKLLKEGEDVVQETRGWDENKQQTFSQRKKEIAADYRYFPDPDLPNLRLSEMEGLDISALKKELPELPWERREKFIKMGVKSEDAEMYVRSSKLGSFAMSVFNKLEENKIALASNYIATDLANLLIRDIEKKDSENKDNIPISADYFVKLINMLHEGSFSSRGAKDILLEMVKTNEDPASIAEKKNLFQASDKDDLLPIVERVLLEYANVAEDYHGGKESALQFLVGQGMKESKGSANPQVLKELVLEQLKNKK